MTELRSWGVNFRFFELHSYSALQNSGTWKTLSYKCDCYRRGIG